jgi:hypothetical protein
VGCRAVVYRAQRVYFGQGRGGTESAGVHCLYDADEQIELRGKYLAEELPAINAEQAAVVVFVSAAYAAFHWIRLERRIALNRARWDRQKYVLPTRFDDMPLPGLLSDIVAAGVPVTMDSSASL